MNNEVSAGFQLFNQAADNNKTPILNELRRYLRDGSTVLEIGSGSGQHAVYFCQQLLGVTWQPTDIPPYLDGLIANLKPLNLPNLNVPMRLDLLEFNLQGSYSAVSCVNVFHIAAAALLEPAFRGGSRLLTSGGHFFIYGPFKYNGQFTTESNAEFDLWLKSRNPDSGIRDIEEVCGIANGAGLDLLEDIAMPANNQLLVFEKR
jgi:SAM-dependent methyltransferase